ncbi:MAG: SurA N-terminal domain-containing protein [Cypionkella sp.]|uniref:SurA N-terminal domain-containing protein n=1 Tax=Cypionkella sp. TaxID=2811411 RepID=UPI002ABC75EB|nr:SurA N-terminal domain-containing protein [Cypionkella sp.]MDZ4312656.1 SurA N-terminal domain-containing protein [Cypionkella sp.]
MAKAPHSDDDTPKKKRRGASVMVWVLMAMLIGGLGGFGVTNFGGGVTSIGTVGDRKIDVGDYARSLRQAMDGFSQQIGQPVTLQQAQAIGLDRQVLQQVMDRAALDNEADRIGLSVGDATVASKVSAIPSFQGINGFDRTAYRDVLRQNNMTESSFESGLRADTARQLLETAITSGLTTPQTLTDTIAAWAGEQRGFSLLRLSEKSLTAPLPPRSDADLQAYYQAHIDAYTRPEAKRISYVALLPDSIAKDMAIDEAALKATYDSRLSSYVVPEKRLVERLAFATEADATAAKARIDAGTPFETLVAERNLTLNDVDMGDVSQKELAAAGDAVFALQEPGVVGPFASAIGPALFRMNAILSAQETSFEQAKHELALEQQLETARKTISDKVEAVDDALAGGATLAEIAKEQGLTLATTDYAPGADDNDTITDYKGFRDTAAKLAEGDFPEAIVLDDGGLVAMELDSTVPPTPLAFDKVKDKVTAAAHDAALAKALSEEAIRIKAAVEAGASLGAFGIVSRTAQIDRQGVVADAPPALLEAVFQMAPNDLRIIETPGFAAVVQLNTISAAATTGEDATALREAIEINAGRAISQDVLQLYTAALTSAAGITLDQAAINAVHAQINN